MALEKMLHISDPREIQLRRHANEITDAEYDRELLEHRTDVIGHLRAAFGGLHIREVGTLGSGGVFVPLKGRFELIDILEEFLKTSDAYPGVSVREVA